MIEPDFKTKEIFSWLQQKSNLSNINSINELQQEWLSLKDNEMNLVKIVAIVGNLSQNITPLILALLSLTLRDRIKFGTFVPTPEEYEKFGLKFETKVDKQNSIYFVLLPNK